MKSIYRGLQKEIDATFDRLADYAYYYTEELFNESQTPITLLNLAKKDIMECVESLLKKSKRYPPFLSSQVDNIENNMLSLLDIITEYAHSSSQYKAFQYIRYYNGMIKVTAKKYPPCITKGEKRNKKNFKTYDRKLKNSVSRARQAIFELAKCNEWEYFVTFTINKRLYDRYNLDVFMKAFRKWLSNYSARKTDGKKIEYVLVPEWGRKFAWHLHGFMNGIPQDHLSHFNSQKQPWLFKNGFLNWKAYENSFGHCAISTPIRSKERVAAYITKQFKKPQKTQKHPLYSNLYFRSQGLNLSTEISRGKNQVLIDAYDYENEFTGFKWYTVEEFRSIYQS